MTNTELLEILQNMKKDNFNPDLDELDSEYDYDTGWRDGFNDALFTIEQDIHLNERQTR